MPTVERTFFALGRAGARMAIHARAGRGVPILCIPGLTRNHRDFDGILDLFPSRPVIRVDLCGRGDSDWDSDPARYTPAVYLADLTAWLATRAEPQFDVIGTSLGGILTMGLASELPQRLRRLVINDIGPVIEAAGIDAIRARVGEGGPFLNWAEAIDAVHAAQFPAHPRETDWPRFARALCRARDSQVVFDYDPAISQQTRAGEIEPFWPLYQSMAGLAVLIIRGECSDLFSAQTLARMLELNPAAEALTVAQTGHAPTLYEPECLAAMGQFLAD